MCLKLSGILYLVGLAVILHLGWSQVKQQGEACKAEVSRNPRRVLGYLEGGGKELCAEIQEMAGFVGTYQTTSVVFVLGAPSLFGLIKLTLVP